MNRKRIRAVKDEKITEESKGRHDAKERELEDRRGGGRGRGVGVRRLEETEKK